jgi:SAM-dependent methyltransferase
VTFKDYFSVQASDYAKHRPTYPGELFDFVIDLAKQKNWAWDCATGNGQAALGLVRDFQKVTATDATEKQINEAFKHPRIDYAVAPASDSGLPGESIDLITVAQALHWFDNDDFFNEARRVLKPGGALAAWAYGHFKTDESVGGMLDFFATQTLRDYWPPENRFVFDSYKSLYFPLHETPAPEFQIRIAWNLDALCGYLKSWSATQNFVVSQKRNPVDDLRRELSSKWGAPEEKKFFSWRIAMRAGRFD